MSVLSLQQRRQFHASFATWLSDASEKEMNQLEQLCAQYPSTAPRSMLTFVTNCLQDEALKVELPAGLSSRLQILNLQPHGSSLLAA